MRMARFDGKFRPGSAATKEKVVRLQNDYERQIGRVQNFTIQQSISSQICFSSGFRSFRALQSTIIDLVNMPFTVDPQQAWTQQCAKMEDVSDVSSCSCAIYLRRGNMQDLSTSGGKRVQPKNIVIWLNL